MSKEVTWEGIVAVLDLHRIVMDVEDNNERRLALFARCLCGWESGREEQPLTASNDEPSRVVIRFAMYAHVADMVLSEGVV